MGIALPELLVLGGIAVAAGVLGFFAQRMLWARLPRLSGTPVPSIAVGVLSGVVTAVLVAAALLVWGVGWAGVAYTFFGIAAVQLSVIDLRLRILPNVLVLPSAVIALVLLTAAAASGNQWGDLLRALAGGGLLFVLYLVLALISPAGLGMGDVKLAGIVGLYLGFAGWASLLLGAAAGFFVGALVGLLLIMLRRAGMKSAIPFGPSILGGAALVLFAAGFLPGPGLL